MGWAGSAGGHEGGTSGFGGGYGGGGGISGAMKSGWGASRDAVSRSSGGGSNFDRAHSGFQGNYGGMTDAELGMAIAMAELNAANKAMQNTAVRANPYTTTPVQDFYNKYTSVTNPRNPLYDQYRNARFDFEQAIRDQALADKLAMVSGFHAAARAATPIGGLPMSAIEDLARKTAIADRYDIGALNDIGVTAPSSWGALPGQGLLGALFGDDEDKYGPDEAMRDAKKQGLVDEENKVSQALAYGPMAYPAAKIVGPLVSQATYGITEEPYSALGLGMAANKAVGSLAPRGYFSGPLATGLGTGASLAGIPGVSAVNTALGLMDKANTLQAAGIRSPNLDNGFPNPGQNQGGGGGLLAALAGQGIPPESVAEQLSGAAVDGDVVPWHRQLLLQQNPYVWMV